MNAKLVTLNVLTLSALAAVILHGQGGPLDPPAAPADGVYRTLEEIYDAVKAAETAVEDAAANAAHDSRTPIDTLPLVISSPGSYYLTRNLHFSSPSGTAIAVLSENVTIDLNGFTISSSEAVTGHAISSSFSLNGERNLTVRNGNIEGTTRVNVSPVLVLGQTPEWTTTEGGFDYGISGASRVENVSVTGCRGKGIHCEFGGVFGTDSKGVIVRGCYAEQNGGIGIEISHGLVADCVVTRNGGSGIRGKNAIVVNSCAVHNGNHGIEAGLLTGCRASRNQNVGLSADAVSSSLAESNGTGIKAEMVSHCTSKSNKDIGIEGLEDAAISFSFSRSNTNANIQTSGTPALTGNSPSQ